MSTDVSGVFISAERLAALEKLEASLPTLLKQTAEDAIKQSKKASLDKLHAKEKENPKQKSANVLANYYKHKDEINAKRRAQYAAKKNTQGPGSSDGDAKNEIV